MKITKYIMDTIMNRIQIEPETECWIWTGSLKNGSPIVHMSGRQIRAIYFIGLWFHNKGVRNAGRTCDNKQCVNPDHLIITAFTVNYDPRHERIY